MIDENRAPYITRWKRIAPYHFNHTTGKGIKSPPTHQMKHTLTFQSKKIGLSIACKKSTLYLCTNKENNAIRQKRNKARYNSLFNSGLAWFILDSEIIKRKSPCFLRRRKAIHYTQQVFRSLSGVCEATPAPKKTTTGQENWHTTYFYCIFVL